MPWTETRPMQRLDFIRACHAGTDSFSALCRLWYQPQNRLQMASAF
jgi:hypothetical protein